MIRREWQWTTTRILLLMVFISLPDVMAGAFHPAGAEFIGSFWSAHDLSQYKAAMEEAATTNSWLIHDHLTPEPHNPALIYPFYVALGKIVSMTHFSTGTVYWTAMIVSRLFLMFAIYAFCKVFFKEVWQRKAGFVMRVGASGLAAFIATAERITGARLVNAAYFPEWNVPEVSTFLTLFTYPHLMVALGLILLAARSYITWVQQGQRRDVAILILAVILIGFANPFSLGTISAVAGVYLVAEFALLRKLEFRQISGTLSVWAASLPFLLYNFLTFTNDPFWGTVYGTQNILPTHSPLAIASGFGLIIPLAVLGAARIALQRSRPQLFLICWIVTSLVLMYLPVPFQRRFAFGLHPFLSVLAGFGVVSLVTTIQNWPGRSLALKLVSVRVTRYALILMLGFSSITLYVIAAEAALGKGELADYVYERESIVVASHWLRDQTNETDVVFANERTGNYLAGEIPGRVLSGHWSATFQPDAKRQELYSFFDGGTTDTERQQILQESRADLVFYGPYEKAVGTFDPKQASYLSPVYENSEVTIYRLNSPPPKVEGEVSEPRTSPSAPQSR